jgi:hypothetical protein
MAWLTLIVSRTEQAPHSVSILTSFVTNATFGPSDNSREV